MKSNGHTIVTGIVRGRTIELERELDLPDGHRVTVSVCSKEESGARSSGEGLKRSAGAWASDDDDFERYLEWTRLGRKQSRPDVA